MVVIELFSVPSDKAVEPFVLAVDVGSTGTRGAIYDAHGRPVLKTRLKVDHTFVTGPDGRSEVDPDHMVAQVSAVLDSAARPEFAGRIAAVAMDTFASSLVGVDADGNAVTACYTYADSRSAPDVEALRQVIDEDWLQQRTGTRLHTSYLPGRLRWLQRTQPDTFDLIHTFMTLGEYIWFQLLDVRGAAVSAAAWSGLLNRSTGDWDAELLARLGLDPGRLAPTRAPDRPFRTVSPRTTERWPALRGAVWFPVVPDGFAANIGAGATDETSVGLSASTSGAMRVLVPGNPGVVPPGLWAYRVSDTHSLLGGALNDVGRMKSWLDRLTGIAPEARDAVLAGGPRPGTPLVLPFLTGERSTGWHGEARAVFADVDQDADAAAFYRGAMEGVAFTYRRVAEQLESVARDAVRVVAAGGITHSLPTWLVMLANVLDKPVVPVLIKRSTLRGTALLALAAVAPGVERATAEARAPVIPNPAWAAEYERRFQRWRALYEDHVGGVRALAQPSAAGGAGRPTPP